MLAALLATIVAAAGCPEGPASGSPLAIDVGAAAALVEVRPDRTDAGLRRAVEAALARLERSGTPVARTTVDAIRSGRVRVDGFTDLTRADFRRVVSGLAGDGVRLRGRWEHLRRAGNRTVRRIESAYDGWSWDDRVYAARTLPTDDLARALAHEVNHVLNASEEHYRGSRAILVEEYRAYLAGELAVGPMPGPSKLRAIKRKVIELYALEGVTPDDVPDLPPGIL